MYQWSEDSVKLDVICGAAVLVVFGLQPFMQAQSVDVSTPNSSSEIIQSTSERVSSVADSSKLSVVSDTASGENAPLQQLGDAQAKGSSVVSGDAPASPASSSTTTNRSFFPRLFKAYHDDWFPQPSSGPEPEVAHRGYPAAVDGPPFPFSDWPYGGSPGMH
jgi:hypothetical protein